jgi:hypothetical protein
MIRQMMMLLGMHSWSRWHMYCLALQRYIVINIHNLLPDTLGDTQINNSTYSTDIYHSDSKLKSIAVLMYICHHTDASLFLKCF